MNLVECESFVFQQIDSLTKHFDLKLYAVKFTLGAGSCTLCPEIEVT